MRRNLELKLPPDTSSQICCHTTLRGVVSTIQLYSKVNLNQTDVKMCNCSKCPRWMIILVRLGGLIYNMCSKRTTSARMHILRRARHWPIDALTVRYSMPYQTFVKMLSQVLFAIYGNHGPWYCHLFMSKEITGEHVILEQFIGHTDSWTLLCFLCNRIFGDFLKKTYMTCASHLHYLIMYRFYICTATHLCKISKSFKVHC